MGDGMDYTLSLRVTQRLMGKIRKLAELCGLEPSEIVRRAGRHIRKYKDAYDCVEYIRQLAGDREREPLEVLLKVRNFPAVELEADAIRLAMEMRIDEMLEKSRKYAPFRTDKQEGRDYVVVQEA